MLASYKVTKYINLPDQVNVGNEKEIFELKCERADNASVGSIIASYGGRLTEKYGLKIAIRVEDIDDFVVMVMDVDEYYDEDDEDYEDAVPFCKDADNENILEVLGEAFAYVGRYMDKQVKDHNCSEKKPCKEKTLSVLKKLLEALDEED